MSRRILPALLAAAALALLAGCSGHTVVVGSTTTIDQTQTVRHTVAPPPPPPTGAIDAGPVSSADADCPYIDKQTAADLEGNRIGRVVVLSQQGKPVGCQFFFDPNWGYPRMTMQITSATYRTSTDAYNAMVRTGAAGRNTEPVHDLVPGVDAVLYQTRFYAPDGDSDWACTFAKGTRLVTVQTDQSDVSYNARHLAETVALRF